MTDTQEILQEYVNKWMFTIYEYLVANPQTIFLKIGDDDNDSIGEFWNDVYKDERLNSQDWFINHKVVTPLFTIWFGKANEVYGYTEIRFKINS